MLNRVLAWLLKCGCAQASAPLLWTAGADLAVALVSLQAGWKLGAGSKAPLPKVVRADCGATRTGHPARPHLKRLEFAPLLAPPDTECVDISYL